MWELVKLGISVSDSTVAKYKPKRRHPPSQTWRTFLGNHVEEILAVDFFTVPTATLRILYVLLVMSHDRRRIIHFNVTDSRRARGLLVSSSKRFRSITAPRPKNHHLCEAANCRFLSRRQSVINCNPQHFP